MPFFFATVSLVSSVYMAANNNYSAAVAYGLGAAISFLVSVMADY